MPTREVVTTTKMSTFTEMLEDQAKLEFFQKNLAKAIMVSQCGQFEDEVCQDIADSAIIRLTYMWNNHPGKKHFDELRELQSKIDTGKEKDGTQS